MSTKVEYIDGKGRKSFRDVETGLVESKKRCEYFYFISQQLIDLIAGYGATPGKITIVGSVANQLATSQSDIDLLFHYPPSASTHEQNILTIAVTKAVNDINQGSQREYLIEPWFETSGTPNSPFWLTL